MSSSKRESPWLVCLLPFAVYLLIQSIEPSPPPSDGSEATKPWHGLDIGYEHYPIIYTIKLIATAAAMVFVWPGYRQYTRRLTWLAVAIGIAGVVLWIVLSQLQLFFTKDTIVEKWIKWLGGARAGFDPLERLRDQPALAYGFLAVRFIGLVVIVPIIEEFFWRGFLMRFVQAEKWWEVPFGTVTPLAVAVGTVFPTLMHPQELVAALIWFSAVTWLMTRTRSIWDCILAHAITNLLLGLYVVNSGEWWLM
jgi:CAAX prenyl protease-like protein